MLANDPELFEQLEDWILEFGVKNVDVGELVYTSTSVADPEDMCFSAKRQIEQRQKLQKELQQYSMSEVVTYLKSPKNTAEDILSSLTQVAISTRFFTTILDAGGLNETQKNMEQIIRQELQTFNTRQCRIFIDPKGGVGKTYLAQYLRAITVLDAGKDTYQKSKCYFILLTATTVAHQASVITEIREAVAKYGIELKLVVLLNLARAYTKYDVGNLEEIMEGIWRYSYKSPVYKTFNVKVFIFCNSIRTLEGVLSQDRCELTRL